MAYCRECSASVPEDVEECPTCGSALDAGPPESEIITEETAIDTDALEKELARSIRPQYEVLSLLGVGGMGAVFVARESALKRLVAVKVLAPELAANRKARVRFQREARAAAAISHANVVRVYAVGETAKQKLPYIVMQYVEGASLAEWIRRRPRVSEREARRIIAEVAAGLAAAHARDLIHRDVKPGNVLIEEETGRALVADFGVAAAGTAGEGKDSTRLTATGIVVGTPIYMSPEQASGSVATPKSDVYSLGILAYELLTGRLPFAAETAMGWVAAHVHEPPTPVARQRADLSPEVVQLVDRCLSKEPRRRPSADDISRGMLPTLATEIDWPPPGLQDVHGIAPPVARAGAIAALAGLLTLVVLAFTPDVIQVHPDWLARFETREELEGSRIVTRATNPEQQGDVSLFVWQAGMMVSAVVFGMGMLYFAHSLVRLSARLVHHRNLGWRWRTLLDVAADPDGRSGLVLCGSREFASLDDKVRRGILRARKLRAGLRLLGGAWVMTAVGGWALLVTVGVIAHDVPAPLAGADALLAATVPALVLVLLAGLAGYRERHLMGRLGRARSYTVTPEDVQEWYRSVGDTTQDEPPTYASWMRTRRLQQVAAVVSALLVAVVLAGLVLLLLTSFVAARFVQRIAPHSAALVPTLDRLAAQDPLATARRAWRSYLPRQRSRADSSSATLIDQLLDGSGTALPAYPIAVSTVLATDAELEWAIRMAAAGNLPADTLELLEEVAEHPRTQAFRQLARVSDLDILTATLRAPIEAIGYLRLPTPMTGNLADPARANTVAAIVALNRGDRATAFDRLGENAALFEHVLRIPVLLPNLIAIRLLKEQVLAPLAVLEDVVGNSTRATTARQASRLLESLRFSTRGMAGLAADPTDIAAYRRALMQVPLLPGHRAELLAAGVRAACANPSEILTGPSRLRRSVLLALADSMPLLHARAIAETSIEQFELPTTASSSIGVVRAIDRAILGAGFRIVDCAS